MKMTYRLVGYDRRTERMADSHIVPDRHVQHGSQVAHYTDDSRDVGDAPLNAMEAKDIAGMINVSIDVQHCDYFLEPSAPSLRPRKHEHA
jgi:hypothetical protein